MRDRIGGWRSVGQAATLDNTSGGRIMTIRNPVEWFIDGLKPSSFHFLGSMHRSRQELADPVPMVRRITLSDLGDSLAKGIKDFGACRTDVLFLGLIYPMVGLILVHGALWRETLPLIFPMISGFALLGPVAAAGLYEMSRRRELGEQPSWADGFKVLNGPSFGPMVGLALIMTAVFVLWLFAAMTIYNMTMGPEAPASLSAFVRDVFTTREGRLMIGVGCGVGFLFALFVLATSVVSFPLLLDRKVTLGTAIKTSVRAFMKNQPVILTWGFIVAASLALGAIPFLLGLIVVVLVLGHATWHLYRKVLV